MLVENFNIATDLKVEMYLPTAIFNPFILGISLMGGNDVLDGDLNPQANWDWIPIEATVATCNISVGGSVESNIYFLPDSARLTVSLQSDDYDPSFNSSIRAGAKIRVRLDDGLINKTLFSGYVDTLSVNYYSQGSQVNIINITAYDSYKRFVNTRLPVLNTSAYPAGFATPLEQLNEIANQSGFVVSASSINIPGELPLVNEVDVIASAYVNDLVQVGLGLIWIDQETGEVVLKDRPDTTSAPVGTWTIGNNHGEAYHLCMSDIEISGDIDSVYNSLKVSLTSNPTTYVIVQDEGSIALYGESTTDIDINTTSTTELTRWANHVFTTSPTKLVKSVETPAKDRLGNLTEAAIFSPGELLKVFYERTNDTIDQTYVITKVNHSINVDNWFTSVELWKGQ